MSFEEPKAPIVRIKKKKVKKKTKDKEIVHLPVRASTQARYSSLTGGQGPQSKPRECCRHMFACCFKLPICKTICFRCILPSCYKDIESDEEDGKDEGYHSQNRGSSEVPTSFAGAGTSTQGATGTSDNAVEMTEIKTEAVALIPPPRTINEYRKDPCSRQASSSSNDSRANQKTTNEITYIEVESMPIMKENKSLDGNTATEEYIPEDEKTNVAGSLDKTSEGDTRIIEKGKEDHIQLTDKVVHISDSPDTDKKFTDMEEKTQKCNTEVCNLDSSEYVECDNIKSKHQYHNLDTVNMPKSELIKSLEHEYVNGSHLSTGGAKVVDYANIDAVNIDSNFLRDDKDSTKEEFDFTASEEPHDYMNLSELEEKKSPESPTKSVRTEISQLVKITKSTEMKTNTEENSIDSLKAKCLETLENGFNDKEIPELKSSKENSISDQMANEDLKNITEDLSENSVKENAFENINVEESIESDSDHENDKSHLVNVGDSDKLVSKNSQKKEHVDKSSDESEDESNGKKVTDQTKLI